MKRLPSQFHKESGFVILFSVLISSIILIMSAGIFRVAQKETVLSSYSRESQRAFYAADAGVECALYWDISNLIAVTKFPGSLEEESYTEPFTCGTNEDDTPHSIRAFKYTASSDDYEHVFGFRYGNIGDDFGCAFVFVEKNDSVLPVDPEDVFVPASVRITGVGYNACEGDVPDLEDPTLLERRLTVSYSSL